MNKKYIIYCPKCKSTFDCSSQLEEWKIEFDVEIDNVIKNLRGLK